MFFKNGSPVPAVVFVKKAEGITGELKAKDRMAWVGVMENIRNRAAEIVNGELIYV